MIRLKTSDDFKISALLRDWYFENKRDLPWRNTKDPYIIWISEIILQQTRVAQGKDYFLRFTERFPDVKSLATAEEDEVLKYWQGLGYYSRARNLHAAAKMIMEKFNGKFPDTYKDVLSLKGVGDYTVAAILSFAWNQPYAVVDGNVFRVLSRLFALDSPIDTGKGKKEFTELANLLLDPLHAGDHNQAIMEFGALHCVPQNPNCMFCPLIDKCMAYTQGKVSRFPVKQGKTKVRNRYFHYFYVTYKDKVWLNRRSEKDIWTGLYEFPLIETEYPMNFIELQKTDSFQKLFSDCKDIRFVIDLSDVKHVLSHQIIHTNFYRVELNKEPDNFKNYISVPVNEIENYAVSKLVAIYLEKLPETLIPDLLFTINPVKSQGELFEK